MHSRLSAFTPTSVSSPRTYLSFSGLLSLVSSMDSHSSSWSDLPYDLLDIIAKRLDSCIHRLRLRAVCHSWRSLPPPSPRPPRRLPFPMGLSRFLNPKRRGYFNLVYSTVYCLQPLKKPTDTSKCWLIRVEESEEPGKFRLTHPLSLPADSQTLSPRVPERLNLLDYRFIEITKVYNLEFVDDGNITDEIDYGEHFSVSAEKVAVCCDKGSRFAVMAIHSAGQLSIWKEDDQEWTSIVDHRCVGIYNDVVYHKGKFYARDSYDGVTISVDLLSERAQVSPRVRSFGEKRLLSYLGDLFLIDWNVDLDAGMRSHFQVHRLINEDEGEWVGMRSLGKRAIFVGDGCSFCVSDEECCECNKNCIYYIDRFRWRHGNDLVEIHPFRNAALFDMEDSSTKFLSKVLGSFGLFWPPPSWVLTWRS